VAQHAVLVGLRKPGSSAARPLSANLIVDSLNENWELSSMYVCISDARVQQHTRPLHGALVMHAAAHEVTTKSQAHRVSMCAATTLCLHASTASCQHTNCALNNRRTACQYAP
jgi:hypothetical protein